DDVPDAEPSPNRGTDEPGPRDRDVDRTRRDGVPLARDRRPDTRAARHRGRAHSRAKRQVDRGGDPGSRAADLRGRRSRARPRTHGRSQRRAVATLVRRESLTPDQWTPDGPSGIVGGVTVREGSPRTKPFAFVAALVLVFVAAGSSAFAGGSPAQLGAFSL